MKTNGKWIYLFYLDKRLVGCFTSSAHCIALWRNCELSGTVGIPSVCRVKPNWFIHKADIRFEDITEIISKFV